MENLIIDFISLILLLPLWIFLIIMCGRFFSVYVNKKIIYFLTLLSSFLGAGICGYSLIHIKQSLLIVQPFIKINDFSIFIGLHIDKLSLMLALLLFIISFAVQMYSVSYMNNDKKTYKFFAFLNLFNFSMGGLLFSPNLFQLYVFWELIGAVSYLLIGFDYKNDIKSLASKRVFIINRIGDTLLIAGIILTSYYMYVFAANKTFTSLMIEDLNVISTILMAYASTPEFYLICILFIVAAAVKSAQFPFYTWLQDAMEAKTPVSALLHSATLVTAGAYLLIRLMPFFTLKMILTVAILVLGILTAVICSILASIETQPKKILAYSTSANLGLVFTAIGALNIKIALILIATHAFIKSALFILLPKDKSLSKINYILFIIFGLSLAGFLFAGSASKELLFNIYKYNNVLYYKYLFICFISAFYIIRLAILIYKNTEFKIKSSFSEIFSYLILLLGNIFIFIILYGTYKPAEPLAASIGGCALAILLGKHDKLSILKTTPKLVENMNNNIIPDLYGKISTGLNYIDIKLFSNYKILIYLVKFFIKIVNWIEVNIMNRTVAFISESLKQLSRKNMLLQSGNVQSYNAYALIILTITVSFIIIGYTLIFG